jgi:putative colanic acid biosynthesis glycosyltransferase WcaI
VRVLLLNQYYWPDLAPTAQLLSDVGAALAAGGHTVTAVASRRAYSGDARHPLVGERDGVRVLRVPATALGRGSAFDRLADYASFIAGAAPLALLARPDVVLALSTPPLVAALGLVVGRLTGARVISWVMDVYPDVAVELGMVPAGGRAARFLRRLAARVARDSDVLVALDDAMRRKLLAQGATPEKVEVIDNWADGEHIRPRADNPLRRRLGLEGVFTVSYSGNMGLGHDFATVVDAMERLRGEPVHWLFIGDGPRRAGLEADCRVRGLRATFLPYQSREELPLGLTCADASLVTLDARLAGLVVPSKLYGILAAGLPVLYVGPDEGRAAEVACNGVGVRVANGDGAGLAEAVRALARDEVLRGRMGREARALFDARFSRARLVERHRRLVERVAC